MTKVILRSWRGSGPEIRLCQENTAGLPLSSFSSAPASAVIGGDSAESCAWPAVTPCSAVEIEAVRPRSDGSAAIGPRNGSAAISCFMPDCTSAVDSKSSPSLAQNGPPSGRQTVVKWAELAASFSVSAAADCSASSAVLAWITTTICGSSPGNWRASRASAWR